MNEKKIIAVLGLCGSGKTESINYLMSKHNFPKVYFGEIIFDEIKARGLEVNEKNEREVREGLRKKFGTDYYAKKIIEKISNIDSPVVFVESLYSWEEYLLFQNNYGKNFCCIAIYSSPDTRYSRLSVRPNRPLTADNAQSRDYSQIENIHQAGPIAMANYTIINESSREALYNSLNEIMEKIL